MRCWIHSRLSRIRAIVFRRNAGAARVVFEDVSFTYAGSKEPALSHISFTAKPGETIGIIGGTGCGKSTLVNLIPRFYDVTSGNVVIDGNNVKEYPFSQLRKKVGMVPQQAVLFKGTIRDNMKWGKEDASEEEIQRALSIAQASGFVKSKPEGLNTMVSQGGANLSGGQRQRLTIARALVGDPEILIMDDSASALDFATDAALRHAIHEQTKGMTVFIVSQRATSIKQADKILVLDDGELAGVVMKDRVSFIKDLWETCKFFFVAPTEYDEKTRKNVGKRTLPNVCWSWRTCWRPWTTSRWKTRKLWS